MEIRHKLRSWIITNKDIVTTLSEGLTALGVIAATGMFFWQWHASKQVEFNAVLISSSPAFMSLLISNSGGVDLAIKQIFVKAEGVKDADFFPKNLNEILLVEKGKSLIVQFDKKVLRGMAVDEDNAKKPGQKADSSVGLTNCSVNVELINADGGNFSKSIKYDCVAACFSIRE